MNTDITDEELEQWEPIHKERPGIVVPYCVHDGEPWPCSSKRFIDSLRATRAEVEHLRAAVDHLASDAALLEAHAEVERLRADNTHLEHLFEEAERLCARCGSALDVRAVGRMGLSGNLHVDDRPADEAITEQQRMTEAYYADPDV